MRTKSGGSEAEKGSGSEEVKRCKKKLPCKELLFKRGQKDRELALLQRIFLAVIFRMCQRKILSLNWEGGSKDVPDFRCEMLGGRPSF